jgi:archaetidylinositol phosphate synthase
MDLKSWFPLLVDVPLESKKGVRHRQKKSHPRVNDILLGPLERPALQWLAAHMPAWIQSDHLTLLGFAGSIIVFASYMLTNVHPGFLWLASFGLLLNWFGDSLDGTLARYRHMERPSYGFYIDHVLDSVSEALVFVGVGLSPYVNLTVALFALVAYEMVSGLIFIMTITRGFFQISYAKIGPTEIRVMGILANAIIFFIGNPSFQILFGEFRLYDMILVGISIMLFCFFTLVALQNGIVLAKLDQPGKK